MSFQHPYSLANKVQAWLSTWFVLKTAFISILVSLFFQVPSLQEVEHARPFRAIIEIGQAYPDQMDYPKDSHIAKKTLRPLLPLMSRIFHIQSPWILYAGFCLMNAAFIAVVADLIRREAADDGLACLLTVGFANTYAGFSGFLDVLGWGDIAPFLFLAIAMRFTHPLVLASAVFLAALGDERAIMAVPFLFFWHWYRCNRLQSALVGNERKRLFRLGCSLASGLVAWMAVRWFMVVYLGISIETTGVGIHMLFSHESSYVYPGFWSAFEAYWIAVAVFAWILIDHKQYVYGVLFVLYTSFYVCVSYLVLDVTRSISYAFPAILVALVSIASRKSDADSFRRIGLVWMAVISVFTPNMRVYGILRIAKPAFLHVFEVLRAVISL